MCCCLAAPAVDSDHYGGSATSRFGEIYLHVRSSKAPAMQQPCFVVGNYRDILMSTAVAIFDKDSPERLISLNQREGNRLSAPIKAILCTTRRSNDVRIIYSGGS